MALATTCPRCRTSFKVVPDQLKLRRGLVRCGVCQHVFSGVDFLRYVDETVTLPAAPAAGAATGRVQSGAPTAADRSAATPPEPARGAAGWAPDESANQQNADAGRPEAPPTDDIAPEHLLTDREGTVAGETDESAAPGYDEPRDDAPLPRAGDSPAIGALAIEVPGNVPRPSDDVRSDDVRSDDVRSDDVRPDSERIDDAPVDDERHDDAPAVEDSSLPDATDADAGTSADSAPVAETEPAFAVPRPAGPRLDTFTQATRRQEADAIDFFGSGRRARGFETRGAAFAWGAAALLTLTLALQVAIGARDWLAAWAPALRPTIAKAVAPLGLTVQPPRSLDALTIESFELLESSVAGLFGMSALLRNSATHPVRWPSLELTLVDGSGAIVARKVLHPADYLGGSAAALADGVAAKSELPVRGALETRGISPTGYSVKVFYP